MAKRITNNQLLGELGENEVRGRFLKIGFQFDIRSRLEAGIDAIAEVMVDGQPLAKMIAVQVKSTASGKYTAETDTGFTYSLRTQDLAYWRTSNLPVIIVLYRQSDESFYWKEIPRGFENPCQKLEFNKQVDVLDRSSVDRLAAITVPKVGQGYFVPPLGGGEEAIINMLPISMPSEMFVATTPYTHKKAIAILLDNDEPARFDWVIHGDSFWSFHDPRLECTSNIVDIDNVEAIETSELAFHEDIEEQNKFSHLLRQTLRHQAREDLSWRKDSKILYFMAEKEKTSREFYYRASKKRTSATVVNAVTKKNEPGSVAYVRHHAFSPRFELLLDQWYLIINPSYYFTTNGYLSHSYPDALLSGKKRMDNNASLRGQVILWHRYLTQHQEEKADLFAKGDEEERYLEFGTPPTIDLPTSVPEDAWGSPKAKTSLSDDQASLELL